jgi:hypothetical protein
MFCKNCSGDRIVTISAKCSDLCVVRYDGKEHVGYVPNGIGIGGDDYVEFHYCLFCGQIQDKFPMKDPIL